MRGPSAPETPNWNAASVPRPRSLNERPEFTLLRCRRSSAASARRSHRTSGPSVAGSRSGMRAARLRRTTDIARVRGKGSSRNDRLFVIHALPTMTGELRVAVSASRALGTAVARNRARRRIREAIRIALRERETTVAADVLIVARPAVRDASAATLRAAVVRELQAVLG